MGYLCYSRGMTNERFTVEIIQRRGVNAVAYVYDNVEKWNERVLTGEDAVRDAIAQAAELNASTLPDPNITGPCQLQASPFCEQTGIQRMDPMDMLAPETSFAGYVSACLTCYEVRADMYVAEVHA
jgi:hypothetical protein